MSIQTQTIWNWPLDDISRTAIQAYGETLADKETQPRDNIPDPSQQQMTVNRYWVDQATAEAWLAFIAPYNPISATIIVN